MLDLLPGTGVRRATNETETVVSTPERQRRRQTLAFWTVVTALLLIRRGDVDIEFEPGVEVELDVEVETSG